MSTPPRRPVFAAGTAVVSQSSFGPRRRPAVSANPSERDAGRLIPYGVPLPSRASPVSCAGLSAMPRRGNPDRDGVMRMSQPVRAAGSGIRQPPRPGSERPTPSPAAANNRCPGPTGRGRRPNPVRTALPILSFAVWAIPQTLLQEFDLQIQPINPALDLFRDIPPRAVNSRSRAWFRSRSRAQTSPQRRVRPVPALRVGDPAGVAGVSRQQFQHRPQRPRAHAPAVVAGAQISGAMATVVVGGDHPRLAAAPSAVTSPVKGRVLRCRHRRAGPLAAAASRFPRTASHKA